MTTVGFLRSIKSLFYIPIIVLYHDNHGIIVMRVDTNEVSSRKNDNGPLPSLRGFEGLRDIMCLANTFLEELEFPPLEKSLAMALTVTLGCFLGISRENYKSISGNERCVQC